MKLAIFLIVTMEFTIAGSTMYLSFNCGGRNPCGKQQSLYFFEHYDPHFYIQCGLTKDQCFYKTCPENTLWSQSVLTCVHNSNASPLSLQAPIWPDILTRRRIPLWPHLPFISKVYDCRDRNPCTAGHAKKGKFHFRHVSPGFFVQCDDNQICSEMRCPEGLIWDDAGHICDLPK